MMFQYVVLFATFFGSLALAKMFGTRQKMWMVPFSVAYAFTLAATIGAIGGFLHFVATSFNFVIVMIMCNGLGQRQSANNPSWKAFLVFYGYMFVIVFTGYFPLEGACTYLQWFLNTFAAGYFMAMWCCQTEGAFKRVLVAVLIGAWFTILYNISHGGFNAANIDATGRIGMDLSDERGEMNVNLLALTVSCFMPFLLVLMLYPLENRSRRFLRMFAGGAFIVLTLILIRTGSRNGTLALLPCAWYFINATKNNQQRSQRIAVGILVAAAVAIGLFATMRGVGLRAFDFTGKGEEFIGHGDVTNGRLEMYRNALTHMSPIEKLVGKGFTLTDNVWTKDSKTGQMVRVRKVNSGNAHSMYMSIFYRSGAIGSILFLIFIYVSIKQGMRLGGRGRIGLLFLWSWLSTGVGEGWGMVGGSTAILAGFAMGMFTNQRIRNPELGGMPDFYYYPPPMPRFGI